VRGGRDQVPFRDVDQAAECKRRVNSAAPVGRIVQRGVKG
jgi:hypothetical protein